MIDLNNATRQEVIELYNSADKIKELAEKYLAEDRAENIRIANIMLRDLERFCESHELLLFVNNSYSIPTNTWKRLGIA